MNSSKEKLKHYRTRLKEIKPRLVSEAIPNNLRAFVPATFDTMMNDFGIRC